MQTYQLESLGDVAGIVLRDRQEPRPGPREIVVRVRAASINKRDAFILKGTYPLPAKPGVVPISDGAGEVVAAGERVSRFKIGDRVAGNYFARWKSGDLQPDVFDQLGCTLDGMLTELAVLDEEWAVRVPDHLSWEEAATLPCAGVTAWNSLVGPNPVVAGQTVLTLGSGGVSLPATGDRPGLPFLASARGAALLHGREALRQGRDRGSLIVDRRGQDSPSDRSLPSLR